MMEVSDEVEVCSEVEVCDDSEKNCERHVDAAIPMEIEFVVCAGEALD